MDRILSDFEAIKSVIDHQVKDFSYLIPKPLMDRIMELLEMHLPHEPTWDKSLLNPNDYVRIGDIQELLSEKNGFCLDDETVFHAVGLIVWAMGKRSISKEQICSAPEPHVMTVEELIQRGDNDPVYLETLHPNHDLKTAIYQPDNTQEGYFCFVSAWKMSGFYHTCNYNVDWRCWDSKPTPALMEAMPWMN